MTKRFKAIEYKGTIPRLYGIEDTTDELTIPLSCLNQRECLQITDLLNEQDQRIQELESQLRQCQSQKEDNGRFKVWQVPSIKEGIKLTTTTSEGVTDE